MASRKGPPTLCCHAPASNLDTKSAAASTKTTRHSSVSSAMAAAAATSGGEAAATTTSGGDHPEQQQQRGAGSLEPAPASGEVEELLGDDHLHLGQQQPEIHRHNNIQAPAFGGSLDSASAIATAAAAVKGRTGKPPLFHHHLISSHLISPPFPLYLCSG